MKNRTSTRAGEGKDPGTGGAKQLVSERVETTLLRGPDHDGVASGSARHGQGGDGG